MRTEEGLQSCLINPKNHHCPENCKSPTEQIEWIKDLLEKIKDNNECHIVCTFSPYILNYLNLAIAKGDIVFDDIEVTEFWMNEDEEGEIVEEENLKMVDDKGNGVIDTSSFSDPMHQILNDYIKCI